ncbi:hypothetical protein ABPG77_000042 [Micractinium sp. CCAP 211/92]
MQPQRREQPGQRAAAAPGGTVRSERRVEEQRGGFLGLCVVQTTVIDTHSFRQCADRVRSLERVHEQVFRRTKDRHGHLLAEEVQQTTVVEDHLGRVHSAHVALHRDGQLVREAAALYLPAGLAAKAAQGALAAFVPAGVLAEASLRSALVHSMAGTDASKSPVTAATPAGGAPVRAVGYVFEGGAATWGLISDLAAAGLPPQQPVRVGSVRPPPWQVLPATPE